MYRKLDHGKLALREKNWVFINNDVPSAIWEQNSSFLIQIGFVLYLYLRHFKKVFIFKYRRENNSKILDWGNNLKVDTFKMTEFDRYCEEIVILDVLKLSPLLTHLKIFKMKNVGLFKNKRQGEEQFSI